VESNHPVSGPPPPPAAAQQSLVSSTIGRKVHRRRKQDLLDLIDSFIVDHIKLDPALASISDTQTDLCDGALKDIGAGHSSGKEEKADTGDGHIRGGDRQVGDRDYSRRTAGDARLNEGGEHMSGPSRYMRRRMIPKRPYHLHRKYRL